MIHSAEKVNLICDAHQRLLQDIISKFEFILMSITPHAIPSSYPLAFEFGNYLNGDETVVFNRGRLTGEV